MNKIGMYHLRDLFNPPKNAGGMGENEFLRTTILQFCRSVRIISLRKRQF